MKRDPRVRPDGRCARKGCAKRLPRSRQAMRYAGDELRTDPFCSTGCCRRYHGTELEENAHQAAQRRRRDWEEGLELEAPAA